MRTYNVAADLKSAADSRSGGSGDPLEQDLLLASRNRGNHIVADEIIWEQYILKNALAGKQRGVFLKPNAPKSSQKHRLGSNMSRIIGHTGRCGADVAKHIAPKFFAQHCRLFLIPLLALSPA